MSRKVCDVFCFLHLPIQSVNRDDRLFNVDLCSSYGTILTRVRRLPPFRPTTTSFPSMPVGHQHHPPSSFGRVQGRCATATPTLPTTLQSALDTHHLASVLLPLCSRVFMLRAHVSRHPLHWRQS